VSLRLRLTLLNGLVLLLAIGAFAGLAYAIQARALQTSLDTSLQEQARWFGDNASLWFDRSSRRPRGVVLPDPRTFSAPDVLIQIDGPAGEMYARSRSLGDSSLPSDPDMLRRAFGGEAWFTDLEVDGEPVRLYVAPLRVGRGAGGEGGQIAAMIEVARPLTSLHESLQSLQTSFLLVGAAGVLVSLVAGWLLARAALRPIDRLAAAAHAIGAARDFSRRVAEADGRPDEVGRLAQEFNRMLAQLEAAYHQLEAALAAQRRFVADASHELRTPLAVLRGNLDLLGSALPVVNEDSEAPGHLLADMQSETERMGRLVGDLLLLAQADAGQHLTLGPVELAPVVRDAFRAARFFREGIELRLGSQPEDIWVAGDADRIKQVLLILLDNALKYTPIGGRVSVEARLSGTHVVLNVADTGPGVPPAVRERIFDRFYRADVARGRGGAGLGLAIARWIVDEHHGKLRIESNIPGPGSVFSIWLPTIPPPPPRFNNLSARNSRPAPAVGVR
jgi:two-component system, OmpR family, sensor kinase